MQCKCSSVPSENDCDQAKQCHNIGSGRRNYYCTYNLTLIASIMCCEEQQAQAAGGTGCPARQASTYLEVRESLWRAGSLSTPESSSGLLCASGALLENENNLDSRSFRPPLELGIYPSLPIVVLYAVPIRLHTTVRPSSKGAQTQGSLPPQK